MFRASTDSHSSHSQLGSGGPLHTTSKEINNRPTRLDPPSHYVHPKSLGAPAAPTSTVRWLTAWRENILASSPKGSPARVLPPSAPAAPAREGLGVRMAEMASSTEQFSDGMNTCCRHTRTYGGQEDPTRRCEPPPLLLGSGGPTGVSPPFERCVPPPSWPQADGRTDGP
jgi:hypothetical protein